MRMESTSPVPLGRGDAPVISDAVQTAGRLPRGRPAGRTLLAARLMARPQARHRVPRLPIGMRPDGLFDAVLLVERLHERHAPSVRAPASASRSDLLGTLPGE
jgi:hypothetical protein